MSIRAGERLGVFVRRDALGLGDPLIVELAEIGDRPALAVVRDALGGQFHAPVIHRIDRRPGRLDFRRRGERVDLGQHRDDVVGTADLGRALGIEFEQFLELVSDLRRHAALRVDLRRQAVERRQRDELVALGLIDQDR